MWRKLNPGEQAKFLGSVMMSVSLLAMAAAIGYIAHVLYAAQQHLPALLSQVEQTTQKIDPLLQQVEATRKLIPPILDEVTAVRGQVAAILAEAAATRAALPPLIDTTAKAVHEASTTIQKVEPHIPVALAEIRQTREALPGLMDRADKLVAGAGKAGQEASKGALFGLVGGIIMAPFKLIGGVGKGLASAIGLEGEKGFTEKDDKLASEATDAAIRAGNIGGEVAWENPDSKNRGTVRLLSQEMRSEQLCFRLRQTVNLASGKIHEAKVEFCQNKDGTWSHSTEGS